MKLGGLIAHPNWLHDTIKLDRCNQCDLENRSIKVCLGLGANRVPWRVKFEVIQLLPIELISGIAKISFFLRLNISHIEWIRGTFEEWEFFKF